MSINNYALIDRLKKTNLNDYKNLNLLFQTCRNMENEDLETALKECKHVKNKAAYLSTHDLQFFDLYNKCLLFEAPYLFDSYLLYVEKNREPEKKFYLPRRKTLKVVADDLQDLEDGKIKFLGVSLPPRIGKSTLCIFFMSWLMGKYPDMANLMSGFSDKLTEGFYTETLSIITGSEYLWGDVFPTCKLQKTSAKNETININAPSRFPTLTCRSIGGTLTGAVEAAKLLYSDDLIEDLEESLNPDRLDSKYDAYLNQLVDRKLDGCLELMVGTRWNVEDPLGRLKETYGDNPEYRFRVIPALDENGESNFVYDYGLGFSTKYYLDIKEKIDDATWCAKYMGDPYVREGLLFPKDELNYYNGILPGGQPDRIISACDVAWGGGDSLSMPFCFQYGDVGYIHDVIFNQGDKEITRPIVVGRIKRHMPHMVRFEANNGGDEYADKVDEELRKDHVSVNISHRKAPNTSSKLSRIIQVAPDIKRLYFIDDKHASKEYKAFMREVTTFTQNGKVKHDDAPDSLAQLIVFKNNGLGTVEVFSRSKLGV